MPPLYLTTQGSKLCFRERRFIVEKDGETVAAVPAVHVEQVLVFGNIALTTPAIACLLDRSIETTFLTQDGRYRGRLVGPEGGNGLLRLRQYERALDTAWALETARAIVQGKLHNVRTLLRRYARRMPEEPEASAVEEGASRSAVLSAAADELTALIESAGRCQSVNSLSGVEGRGAAVYFGVFRSLITAPGWTFEGRNRRPPRDPVNALLSFGYTVLLHNLESAVRAVGLDPYLGFLHQPAYNRPSLALDLAEEFRSIVVDSVVLRCMNNNIILPEMFRRDSAPGAPYPVLLDDEGRGRFIRELEARLALEFRHPDSEERVTYRRCFELQARRMARCIQTGERYRPFSVR